MRTSLYSRFFRTQGEFTERGQLLDLMSSAGWIAPFLPSLVKDAADRFEANPSEGTALALESAVNSFTTEPVLLAVSPEPEADPATLAQPAGGSVAPGIPAGGRYVPLINTKLVQDASLTGDEARSVLLVLDALFAAGREGASAENVFSWGEKDSLLRAADRAFYKLFRAAGRPTPTKLDTEALEMDI